MYMYSLNGDLVKITCHDDDVIVGTLDCGDDVIIRLIDVDWYRVDKDIIEHENSFLVYRDEIKTIETLKTVDMI